MVKNLASGGLENLRHRSCCDIWVEWRKKIAKQVFLLQLRRLLSKFYCFCLADTVAVSLSFSLLLSLLQLQCHNPFLFQFAIVCGWERQCEEEREWERESIGLRLREGIQFPSVMAWLWGTAAALIRLGGSKFSSHNIQKWFFSLFFMFIFWPQSSGPPSTSSLSSTTSRWCVCVCVRVRVFERERERDDWKEKKKSINSCACGHFLTQTGFLRK